MDDLMESVMGKLSNHIKHLPSNVYESLRLSYCPLNNIITSGNTSTDLTDKEFFTMLLFDEEYFMDDDVFHKAVIIDTDDIRLRAVVELI